MIKKQRNVTFGKKSNNQLGEKNKKVKTGVHKAEAVVLTMLIMGFMYSKNDKESDDELYLIKVDNCDSDVKLLDSDGNEINVNIKEGDMAIVDSKKTVKGKEYPIVLINSENQMIFGYIDGRYLEDKKILDSINSEYFKIKKDNKDNKENSNVDKYIISEVYPQDGVWLREGTTVDTTSKEALRLLQKTNIVTSSSHFTSKDNSYSWVKAIWVNKGKFKTGFVASDYVLRKDYDSANCKKFVVSTVDNVPLKLRKEPGNMSDDNVLWKIPSNSKIEVLYNIKPVRIDNIEWYYVAYKHDDVIEYGYVSANVYNEDGTINMHNIVEDLSDVDSISASSQDDNYKMLHIDTSADGNINLKLRNAPGLKSSVISYIENGSSVFSYQSIIDNSLNSEKVDGHTWIKVITLDGQVGYVAADYLTEIKEKVKSSESENTSEEVLKEEQAVYSEVIDETSEDLENSEKSDTMTMSFSTTDGGNTNNVEGYFAIDIPDTFNVQLLEKILKENNSYDSTLKDDGSYSLKTNAKPSAVIIKLGATGYGLSYSAGNPCIIDSQYDNIRQLISVCEKYEVPYGFYYYSQALTKDEANKEIERISNKLDEFGSLPYNKLPIYLDVESPENGRLYNYCVENNIDTTDVVNYEMNTLREITGKEVAIYTDYHTLNKVIDFNKLEEQNKTNMWCVEVSPSHTDNVIGLDKYVSMRQVALDRDFNGSVVDYDFISKDYFDSLMKEKEKSLVR